MRIHEIMKHNKIILVTALIVVLFVCLVPADVLAQCPMCKMSAESNMKNGGTAGRGLNAGILYMLIAPYLIVGSIGYWWWRNRNNSLDAAELEQE
jgi:hypothetical protein